MMNETPEASPPAFPYVRPTAPGRRASGTSDRMLAARLEGVPKYTVLGHETPAGERPQDPAGELAEPAEAGGARHGIWRVAVAEQSMSPALLPGDWLLVDPTCTRWPRRGSIVVFREPDTETLAIKRVAAHSGDRVRISQGILHLAPDEAWLLGDNLGPSIDSRRYGPVPLELLVGRAWFRYGPMSRFGLLGRR